MNRKLFRLFRAWILAGVLMIAIVACRTHTSSQHCSSALSDMRVFPEHRSDYLAHVGVRTWNSNMTLGEDHCTIRGTDGHYHYVTINVDTEGKTWR